MRFRNEWILVPLACLATAWVLHVIRPAYVWNDLMIQWGIEDKRQFTMLACLGCTVVAVVAIARAVKRNDDD